MPEIPAPSGEPGYYAIVNGSDDNPAGTPLIGYAGVSTYETGGKDQCEGDVFNALNNGGGPVEDTDDNGGGTNSGGCGTVRGVVSVPGLPFACGNTSGQDWASAGRDGCTIP